MSAPLRVITANAVPVLRQDVSASIGQRVRELQAEAQHLANEHVKALMASLAQTQALADEIANGGESYPPGVRDIARRLAEDSDSRARTLEMIAARTQPRG